jgi:hypothetical protein
MKENRCGEEEGRDKPHIHSVEFLLSVLLLSPHSSATKNQHDALSLSLSLSSSLPLSLSVSLPLSLSVSLKAIPPTV